MSDSCIAGQLSDYERGVLRAALVNAAKKPEVVIEVGTWLGGGSTLNILQALQHNGIGHLWGIEADRSVYQQMLSNIGTAGPEISARFTPLFGRSGDVIPRWLAETNAEPVDFVFLDGGNNPGEQIQEFKLLDPCIPAGGQLMSHDAKMRKGKWLVPYLSCLDNWRVQLHEPSEFGLMHALKLAPKPSPASRRAAEILLLKMRAHPVEIAAACLPARVCGFILGLLPTRFARRLSDGRV